MTDPDLRAVAAQLVAVRTRALHLTFDLRRIAQKESTAEYARHVGLPVIRSSADRYLDATTRARDHAATLGWSRSLHGHPSLAAATVTAFERALGDVRVLSGDLELDLARARDTALEMVQGGGFRGYRIASMTRVAYEIEVARQRAFDSFDVDLDPAAARRAVAALVFGQRLAQVHSPSGVLARRLLAASVQVLPPQERLRYDEEFRSELSDIPPRRQLMYTLRLLGRSWQLRAELVRRHTEDDPSTG